MKRKKKTNKRKLKDKLEKLVKAEVKFRDNYTCQRCGKKVEGSNCHASHIIPVSRDGRLAYDPNNMIVLCYYDHISWWHKHPIEAAEWFNKKFPGRYEMLREKYNQNTKGGSIKESWYEEQIKFYLDIIVYVHIVEANNHI